MASAIYLLQLSCFISRPGCPGPGPGVGTQLLSSGQGSSPSSIFGSSFCHPGQGGRPRPALSRSPGNKVLLSEPSSRPPPCRALNCTQLLIQSSGAEKNSSAWGSQGRLPGGGLRHHRPARGKAQSVLECGCRLLRVFRGCQFCQLHISAPFSKRTQSFIKMKIKNCPGLSLHLEPREEPRPWTGMEPAAIVFF